MKPELKGVKAPADACASCGVKFVDHLGIIGTCALRQTYQRQAGEGAALLYRWASSLYWTSPKKQKLLADLAFETGKFLGEDSLRSAPKAPAHKRKGR